MIVDLILDRKDYEEWAQQDAYNAKDLYNECMQYSAVFDGAFDYITRALDYGTEEDVRKALCRYIDENEYNEKIKDYIDSRDWLD